MRVNTDFSFNGIFSPPSLLRFGAWYYFKIVTLLETLNRRLLDLLTERPLRICSRTWCSSICAPCLGQYKLHHHLPRALPPLFAASLLLKFCFRNRGGEEVPVSLASLSLGSPFLRFPLLRFLCYLPVFVAEAPARVRRNFCGESVSSVLTLRLPNALALLVVIALCALGMFGVGLLVYK